MPLPRSSVPIAAIAPERIDGDQDERGAGDDRHRQHASARPVRRVAAAARCDTGQPAMAADRGARRPAQHRRRRTSAPTTSSAAPAPKNPAGRRQLGRQSASSDQGDAAAAASSARRSGHASTAPRSVERRRRDLAGQQAPLGDTPQPAQRPPDAGTAATTPPAAPIASAAGETCSVSAVVPTASTHQVVSAVMSSEA